MLGRDRTGPLRRSAPAAGRGVGRGIQGSGRMGRTHLGSGPDGNCICPKCGEKVPHRRGVPCYNESCPKCGTRLVRG